mmetsp:Transcript_31959/g.99739  ORF Transcript_31959/g.99739 Transcript_31959/m.99739 type:complete len:228 (+) Transcript_31959:365-1048(+)
MGHVGRGVVDSWGLLLHVLQDLHGLAVADSRQERADLVKDNWLLQLHVGVQPSNPLFDLVHEHRRTSNRGCSGRRDGPDHASDLAVGEAGGRGSGACAVLRVPGRCLRRLGCRICLGEVVVGTPGGGDHPASGVPHLCRILLQFLQDEHGLVVADRREQGHHLLADKLLLQLDVGVEPAHPALDVATLHRLNCEWRKQLWRVGLLGVVSLRRVGRRGVDRGWHGRGL